MCEYCREDSDGYVKPIEKNGHAFIRFGMDGWEISLNAKGWHGAATIKYCPMCGRKLLPKHIECREESREGKTIELLKELKEMQGYLKMDGIDFVESYCKPCGIPIGPSDTWAFRCGMALGVICKANEFLETEEGEK